ncbi:hypothetical protein [Tautonia rosea]|uniref:hypothetical protein n=1 Tax=Tautonia rosea TaxID=2728037 RepID=UPI001474A1BA|nr:hypothetical protein [Tautonia rosea]
MDWQFLLGLSTAIGAIAGWFVLHILEGRRHRENRRRELITQLLIEAYRRLEGCVERSNPLDLESAIADIQLFGSRRQVELAQAFAVQFANEGSAILDNVLVSLRDDLHRELRLEAVPRTLMYFRIHETQGDA